MKISNVLWLYLISYLFNQTIAERFTRFHNESLFDNLLCLSSATKFSGKYSSLLLCAIECAQTDDCMSFFYSSHKQECYSVTSVLTSRSDCVTSSGTHYFARQLKHLAKLLSELLADFILNWNKKDKIQMQRHVHASKDFLICAAENACYNYTLEERNKMLSEKDRCESVQFHVYTAGNNQAYIGCMDCHCCQWKGCYTGGPLDYNGTWSQTKYGRRCQRWDTQSPHSHTRNHISGFPFDASVSDAHNYCRDPDGEGGPWCYTEDPEIRWEFCDIPTC